MSEPEIAEFWRNEEELEAKKKKIEISRVNKRAFCIDVF